jgi:transposase
MDLRTRVVEACHAGGTVDGVAKQFGVGRASVIRWLRREREFGTVKPGKQGGSRRPLLIGDEQLPLLADQVAKQGDLTREEYIDAFESLTGIRVSVSTMGRALKRAGFTRKKRLFAQRNGTERTSSSRAKSGKNSKLS